MAGPGDVLPDGMYTVRGPGGLVLLRDGSGRPTIAPPGNPHPSGVWEVKAMFDRTGQERSVSLINALTGERLCATDPYQGGEPLPPPRAGDPVYLTGGSTDDQDYALWIPWFGSGSSIALTALNSYSWDSGADAMVLNIAGDSWQPGGNLITWPWSGGQPNEVWSFQPCPEMVDQEVPLPWSSSGGGDDQWQSITAGITGAMTRLDLLLASPDLETPAAVDLFVYDGVGTSGQELARTSVLCQPWSAQPKNQMQPIRFTAPIPVRADRPYTFRLKANVAKNNWIGFRPASVYPRGRSDDGYTAWVLNTWVQTS